MKLSYLPFCLFGLLLFGCPSEDDAPLTPEPVTITGTWDVVDFASYEEGILVLSDTLDYSARYEYDSRSEGMEVTFSSDGTIVTSGELLLEHTITEDGTTDNFLSSTDGLWWIADGTTYRVENDELIFGGNTNLVFSRIEIITLTEEELIFEGTIARRKTSTTGFVTDGTARYTLMR